MTTMDSPTISQFILMRLAARRTARSREAITRTGVQLLTRVALHIAGFSSLTYGAFMWDKIAGFIVLGVSCFVMSALTASTPVPPTDNRRRMQ